jgi:hypothetical protein
MQHTESSRPRRSSDRATLTSVLVTIMHHLRGGLRRLQLVGRAVLRSDAGDGDQDRVWDLHVGHERWDGACYDLPTGPLGARAGSSDGMVTR